MPWTRCGNVLRLRQSVLTKPQPRNPKPSTQGLGFRGLGFRGLGFSGLGFRSLGFRVQGNSHLLKWATKTSDLNPSLKKLSIRLPTIGAIIITYTIFGFFYDTYSRIYPQSPILIIMAKTPNPKRRPPPEELMFHSSQYLQQRSLKNWQCDLYIGILLTSRM